MNVVYTYKYRVQRVAAFSWPLAKVSHTRFFRIHIHTYIHTYTHTHAHVHTYMHTHIHTYIHTCTHTHTYIHTYTHTCRARHVLNSLPNRDIRVSFASIYIYIHKYTHTYRALHVAHLSPHLAKARHTRSLHVWLSKIWITSFSSRPVQAGSSACMDLSLRFGFSTNMCQITDAEKIEQVCMCAGTYMCIYIYICMYVYV